MDKISLKKIYLYFFTAVGLILVIVAGIRLVNLSLKTFVLTQADTYPEYPSRPGIVQPSQSELQEYQKKQKTAQRQRELADSLSMTIIGLPLYLYHWRQVKKMMEDEK